MKKAQVLLVMMVLGILSIPLWGQNEDITASEKEDLMYMFEEEKMARDVYMALNEKWSVDALNKINEAEIRHVGIIRNEMKRLGIEVTEEMLNDEPGIYHNKSLQANYNGFIEEGSYSEELALRVAARIEEKDICDLREAIDDAENLQISRLYISLLNGSERHLRTFVRAMEERGIVYSPAILDPVDYELIIVSKNFSTGLSN